MSVTSLKHLPKLEMVLFGRPAGRNIFDFAANEIVSLRKRNAILEAMLIHRRPKADYDRMKPQSN